MLSSMQRFKHLQDLAVIAPADFAPVLREIKSTDSSVSVYIEKESGFVVTEFSVFCRAGNFKLSTGSSEYGLLLSSLAVQHAQSLLTRELNGELRGEPEHPFLKEAFFKEKVLVEDCFSAGNPIFSMIRTARDKSARWCVAESGRPVLNYKVSDETNTSYPVGTVTEDEEFVLFRKLQRVILGDSASLKRVEDSVAGNLDTLSLPGSDFTANIGSRSLSGT